MPFLDMTVFITGSEGFIAQHIIKQLLAQDYQVVGSVRAAENGEIVSKNFASPNFSYAVVPDMAVSNCYDEVFEKHPIEVVIHTACLVTIYFDPSKGEEIMIKPAVAGTLNILSAVEKYGTKVKHLVVTSSVASMVNPFDRLKTINEESRNPITLKYALSDPFATYSAAKTFAEKALWDYVDEKKPSYSVTTVHPVYVFGPQAYDSSVTRELNFTSKVIKQFLTEDAVNLPNLTQLAGSFVDVRDVARAHLLAFQKNAHKKRLLLASEPFDTHKILHTLAKTFPGKVQKPKEEYQEPTDNLDSSKTEEFLGIKYVTLEASLKDAIQQILDNE